MSKKKFNEKQRLIKNSLEVIKEKHPKGFTKQELIKTSKELYGGRGHHGGRLYTKIENEIDIVNQRSAMVNIDGHYPANISDCFVVGINGDCGVNCPVFLKGECKVEDPEAFIEQIKENRMESEVKILYPNVEIFKNL